MNEPLCDDVWFHIFNHLSLKDLFVCSQVSRSWSCVCRHFLSNNIGQLKILGKSSWPKSVHPINEATENPRTLVRIVTACPAIHQLSIVGSCYPATIESIPLLTRLHNLTSLTVSRCDAITNELGLLAACPLLVELTIRNCKGITSLAWIQDLKLRTFNLMLSRIVQLEPLASLAPTLKSLCLNLCRRLSNLEPIASLVGLLELRIMDCACISDVSHIAKIQNLATLSLTGCRAICDISCLSNMWSLTQLDVSNCPELISLRPIDRLKPLKTLSVASCFSLTDFDAISDLTSLQSVKLNGCTLSQIPSLNQLQFLTELNISLCNQLISLEPLVWAQSLEHLELALCDQFSDLTPLSSLTSLRSLDLFKCTSVEDISPLEPLSNLVSLDIAGCFRIQDLSPLLAMKQLESVTYSQWNVISSLGPTPHHLRFKLLKSRFV
jgi:Leucine-rich repeat (LRR) protein